MYALPPARQVSHFIVKLGPAQSACATSWLVTSLALCGGGGEGPPSVPPTRREHLLHRDTSVIPEWYSNTTMGYSHTTGGGHNHNRGSPSTIPAGGEDTCLPARPETAAPPARRSPRRLLHCQVQLQRQSNTRVIVIPSVYFEPVLSIENLGFWCNPEMQCLDCGIYLRSG